MKAILEFVLPGEREEYKNANQAQDLNFCLSELRREINALEKIEKTFFEIFKN